MCQVDSWINEPGIQPQCWAADAHLAVNIQIFETIGVCGMAWGVRRCHKGKKAQNRVLCHHHEYSVIGEELAQEKDSHGETRSHWCHEAERTISEGGAHSVSSA